MAKRRCSTPKSAAKGKSATPTEKRLKSQGDLMDNLLEEAIERMNTEFRRVPAKAFAAEKMVFEENFGGAKAKVEKEEDDASKPYPDSYNVMRFIPKGDKQEFVRSLKPDYFDEDTCELVLTKGGKDVFANAFYILTGTGPGTTVPKLARHKNIFKGMCLLRYKAVCTIVGCSLIDKFVVDQEYKFDWTALNWWRMVQQGDTYTHISCLDGKKVELDEPMKADLWHLEKPHLLHDALLVKIQKNTGLRQMPQTCVTFFAPKTFVAYEQALLTAYAKQVSVESSAADSVPPGTPRTPAKGKGTETPAAASAAQRVPEPDEVIEPLEPEDEAPEEPER